MLDNQMEQIWCLTCKCKRNQLHAKEDRSGLLKRLLTWRDETELKDPFKSTRPATYICDDPGLELLSKIHPSNIRSAQDIIDLLHETSEWGMEFALDLYATIHCFDKARFQKALMNARPAKQPRILL